LQTKKNRVIATTITLRMGIDKRDQRYYNVHGKMGLGTLPGKQIKGAIVLFDDYIGTGSTVKEAARVLRKKFDEPELIPLTIAHLKWRLGKPGFI